MSKLRCAPSWALLFVLFLSVAAVSTRAQPLDAQEVRVAETAFSKGAPTPNWVLPTNVPTTQLKAPVVLRLADTQIRVDPSRAYYVRRVIQVNDSGSLGQIGQYAIDFVPQYQKLHLHQLRLWRGGQTIDVLNQANIRFMQREAGLEDGVVSGRVTALILIPGVRVGDSLEVAYTEEGSNPVFGDKQAQSAGWDQTEPVELRRVIYSFHKSRPMKWRLQSDQTHSADLAPLEQEHGGMKRWIFSAHSLPATEPEPFVPQGWIPQRYLQFSEWGHWNTVALWASDLFPPVTVQNPALLQLKRELNRMSQPEQKVLAALQWVQSEVRYFSVSLGESSHRPHHPDHTAHTRYGDCKDKTYLLMTLLREQGIEAQPVLLSLYQKDGIRKLMPSPDAFDHVIVRAKVDGRWFYLDPTRQRQVGRLATLGLGLHGYDALVVDPRTDTLSVITNTVGRDTYLSELHEQIQVPELKSAGTLKVHQIWKSGPAESMRAFLAQGSIEQKAKFALNGYERRYPGIELDGAPEFEDEPDANVVTMRAKYRIPKLLIESNGEWALRFFPNNLQGVFNIPENIRRKNPVALFYQPYDARYHLTVLWPDAIRVVRDPLVQRVKSEAFDLEVSAGFRGNKAQHIVEFHTRNGTLQPSALPQFLEDLRQLDKVIDGVVYVDRDAVVASATKGLDQPSVAPTLQATIQNRLQQRLSKLNKTIESGRLQGDDLAAAYCDKAETLADMEQIAQGSAEAERALALAPDLARAWSCRANLNFSRGQFLQSIADHTKALALGGDPFEVYYRRGVSRYYASKLPEALQDFERAITQAPHDSAKRYAMLWMTWTARALKRPLPELVTQATPPAGGTWPWPAQAMLMGRVTESQVLEFVEGKTGDDKQLALTEAWFYIGQNQLLAGNTELAVASFEKARQQAVTVYLEHVAAGFELARLKPR